MNHISIKIFLKRNLVEYYFGQDGQVRLTYVKQNNNVLMYIHTYRHTEQTAPGILAHGGLPSPRLLHGPHSAS